MGLIDSTKFPNHARRADSCGMLLKQNMSAKRKVLLVSIGKGGNQIANTFFERLLRDNGVTAGGSYSGPNSDGLKIFCDESKSGTWTPRRIFVDLNHENLLAANSSAYGTLHLTQSSVVGSSAIDPNWAKGFHGAGSDLAEQALVAVKTNVDALQGACVIWVMHTLGGGCGSGLGSLLLDRLAEELPNVPRVSIAVLPSDKVTDSVTQTYNAGLALSHILPAANQMICIDNTQLYDICFRGGIPTPKFADLNELISRALNTLVTPLIWPGADGKRMTLESFHEAISLAPDRKAAPWHERNAGDVAPELKVVSLAAWPHTFFRDQATRSMSDSNMAAGLASDALSTLAPSSGGKWIKILGVLSGPGAAPAEFAASLPRAAQAVSNQAKHGETRRASAAGCHTGVSITFKDLYGKFREKFSKKAYLHWYTEEGMDESDFNTAADFLGDLARATPVNVMEQGNAPGEPAYVLTVDDFDSPEAFQAYLAKKNS